MIVWTIARESTELVGPIAVADDGAPVLVFEVALVLSGHRPAVDDWAAPVEADGSRYLLVGPGEPPDLPAGLVKPPGIYELWARYDAPPERPVMEHIAEVHIS